MRWPAEHLRTRNWRRRSHGCSATNYAASARCFRPTSRCGSTRPTCRHLPDVTVVCGPRESAPIDKNAVSNPTLLIEVTSNSTEDYDREEKLNHYKQCPSVRAVVFVSHRRAHVTVVERLEDGWSQREFRSGETLEFSNPEASISVDDLYEGIALDE